MSSDGKPQTPAAPTAEAKPTHDKVGGGIKRPGLDPASAKPSGLNPGSARSSSKKHDELRLLINSRHPIITVETTEEERLTRMLVAIAAELGVPLYEWSVVTGLAKHGGAPIYGTEQPEQALANIALIAGDGIFLLRDFARYCENDRISRRVRDLADKCRVARRSLAVTAAVVTLPPELEADAAPFHLALPSAEELLPGIRTVLAEVNRERGIPPARATALDAAGMAELARNLVGLTEEEAMRTLRKCLLASGGAGKGLAGAALEAKRNALHSDGLLDSIRADISFADIAGLRHLREWVDRRRNALTLDGQRFGLVPPKGILMWDPLESTCRHASLSIL